MPVLWPWVLSLSLFVAVPVTDIETPKIPAPKAAPGLAEVTWDSVTPEKGVMFFMGRAPDGSLAGLAVCKNKGCEVYRYVDYVSIETAPKKALSGF